MFIAGTFVVATAVDSTGVTTWIGQKLLEQSGSGRAKLLVLIMVICALITALITPNASVAALIPAVVIVAMRSRQKPSALLMPMAFGAHAGALLALTGSPVNVLVADALADAGGGRLGFFEFTLAGVPILIGTVAICVYLGPKLVPDRTSGYASADFQLPGSDPGGRLRAERPDRKWCAVRPRSWRGRGGGAAPFAAGRHGGLPGHGHPLGELVVLAVRRRGDVLGPKPVTIAVGDVLVLRGSWEALAHAHHTGRGAGGRRP